MAWRALLRRCPSRSFTVVGDLDQRRGNKRPPTWEKALGPAARALAAEVLPSRSPTARPRPSRPSLKASSPAPRRARPVPDDRRTRRRGLLPRHPRGRARGRPGLAAGRQLHCGSAVARAQREAEERLDREAGTSRGRIAIIVGNERARAWGADVAGETALSEACSPSCLPLPPRASNSTRSSSSNPPRSSATASETSSWRSRAPPTTSSVVHSAPLPAGMEEW